MDNNMLLLLFVGIVIILFVMLFKKSRIDNFGRGGRGGIGRGWGGRGGWGRGGYGGRGWRWGGRGWNTVIYDYPTNYWNYYYRTFSERQCINDALNTMQCKLQEDPVACALSICGF